MKYRARRLLNAVGLLPLARRLRERATHRRRAAAARERADLERLAAAVGKGFAPRSAPGRGRLLVTGAGSVAEIALQAPLLLGFRAAGFRPIILLMSRNHRLSAGYRLFGVTDFAYFEDYLTDGRHPQTETLLGSASRLDHILDLSWRGALVGRYAISTLMRRLRRGDLVLDETTRPLVAAALSETLRCTDAAAAILDRLGVAAAIFNDHGYTPNGQVFDLLMARGGACFTWNAAHRDGALMLKRYEPRNRDQHPSSLSEESWTRLKAVPWSAAHWRLLREEIEGCYRSGEWYGEVGTQFGKSFPDRATLARRLGLDPAKKTAAIFPHIFWDATFFWGTDLFRNYEDWFLAALRAACANPALNWVIKVHPGNLVKDRRDGVTGEHSEIAAIRAAVGELPPHVRLIPAASDVSTLALFPLLDYCLTVRGTVGIEAACFGITVVTAGTGRYDRRGFTIDPQSPAEYRDILARLETIARPDAASTELARRYAYGVLIARPTPLTSMRFGYARNATASLLAEWRLGPDEDPATAPDIAAIAQWVGSGDADYISGATLGPPGETGRTDREGLALLRAP